MGRQKMEDHILRGFIALSAGSVLRSLLLSPLLGGLGREAAGGGRRCRFPSGRAPGPAAPQPLRARGGQVGGSCGEPVPAIGKKLLEGPQDQPHTCFFSSQANYKTFYSPGCTCRARSGIRTSKPQNQCGAKPSIAQRGRGSNPNNLLETKLVPLPGKRGPPATAPGSAQGRAVRPGAASAGPGTAAGPSRELITERRRVSAPGPGQVSGSTHGPAPGPAPPGRSRSLGRDAGTPPPLYPANAK
ncbi:uncharacterized protein LOC115599224 [Calypte anna]|uniref:uncharacterized protein LOC115599224 n=1 Tax=Calypte anna TaxID=9244 RepID=UPI0011C3B76F|nr:uncharacterized protein LOC115599224 [Calypte anna]